MSDPPNKSYFSHYPGPDDDDPFDGYEEYDDILPEGQGDDWFEENEEIENEVPEIVPMPEPDDEVDNENVDFDIPPSPIDDEIPEIIPPTESDDYVDDEAVETDIPPSPIDDEVPEIIPPSEPDIQDENEYSDENTEQEQSVDLSKTILPVDSREEATNEAMKTVLDVENVSVRFGGVSVLRNISFSVREGETIAIIGESGCGKTVMLKTLINLFRPSQGRILFDGKDLAELSYFDLADIRTRYGYVFQQAALFDSLTIGDNIAFPLIEHTKKTKTEIDDIVFRLLREVGLSEETYFKKPAELSGGMRKRVGFARALALEPEMMLYDEPTTGLDPIMSDIINELIIKTHEQHNVTSVMVTHDMKSACKVADRIIMLYPISRLDENENQMIFDGTPEELDVCEDRRVWQFLHGVAGERLQEMENGKWTIEN